LEAFAFSVLFHETIYILNLTHIKIEIIRIKIDIIIMKSIVPIIYLFFILSNNIYSQNCEYALIPGISQMNAIRSPGGLPESGKPGIQSNYQNIICNIDKEPNAELELLWRKDLNTTVSSPLLIGANKIYAAAVNGKIYSFDLDGNLIWQNSTGGTIYSRPVLSDSILFLGTNEGDLVSINADNGKIIQTLGLNESITSLHIIQDIEYNGAETKGIIIGTSKGSL
jgi:outer membrane protein assembly factor BamB